MGYDLTNDNGTYLRFSPSGWALALDLAKTGGWQPEGTLPPQDYTGPNAWHGDYDGNDGQRVSTADALSLATGCERVLADPNYLANATAVMTAIHAAVVKEVPSYVPRPFTSDDMISFRQRLQELATFCREGGFIIE